ncbi:MAG: hypothetical protein ACUVTP_11810 [Candidatus Fervidibacter sp.]|uniref:hypothetical protein n=1 Tax=Candidatus Fervidibacter sp. TaxID=3100871 RepID=UPI00404B7961
MKKKSGSAVEIAKTSHFSIIHVALKKFRPRHIPETAFSITKVFADAFRTVVLVSRTVLVIAIWVLVFGVFWLLILGAAWWLTRKVQGLARGTVTSESE